MHYYQGKMQLTHLDGRHWWWRILLPQMLSIYRFKHHPFFAFEFGFTCNCTGAHLRWLLTGKALAPTTKVSTAEVVKLKVLTVESRKKLSSATNYLHTVDALPQFGNCVASFT